jgi:hypothetical protein
MALRWRDPPRGLVHHSDRGSQAAAGDYRKMLDARGITVSMSRKGRLLGQRADGISQRHDVGRTRARGPIPGARRGSTRAGRELWLLQHRADSFVCGLPDAE